MSFPCNITSSGHIQPLIAPTLYTCIILRIACGALGHVHSANTHYSPVVVFAFYRYPESKHTIYSLKSGHRLHKTKSAKRHNWKHNSHLISTTPLYYILYPAHTPPMHYDVYFSSVVQAVFVLESIGSKIPIAPFHTHTPSSSSAHRFLVLYIVSITIPQRESIRGHGFENFVRNWWEKPYGWEVARINHAGPRPNNLVNRHTDICYTGALIEHWKPT